jgi:hypothetical protein
MLASLNQRESKPLSGKTNNVNYAIETAIACALLGTPAAFMAAGFRIRESLLAGVFALAMLAILYILISLH